MAAATSLRTIQTLSSTSGQAWTVARTTTAAAAANPAVAHSHAHHLTLYNTPNPATHNPASDTASSQPNITTTASSPISPSNSLNTSPTSPSMTATTSPTTPTTTTGSSTATATASAAHFNRPTINQYQSINSHNQYIYNHHLQLSHNHSQQQQQQRRALQLQSQTHALNLNQQRQQGHQRQQGYQQQQQQFQGYNLTQHQGQRFQDQPFLTGSQTSNSNNPYNAPASARQGQRNSMMHPRAPLHYRSASPPTGASAGSAIQASTTNPFRVHALPTLPHPSHNHTQHRKSPPPTPTPTPNRRRSASIRVAPPSLPLPMMQQNAGVSASNAPYAAQQQHQLSKSAIRFDPFADESDVLEGAGLNAPRPPVALSVTTPLSRTPSRTPSPPHSHSQPQQHNNVPYTIQIPAAGAREIQQYALRNQLGGHRLTGPRRSPSPPSPIARPVSPPKAASIEGAPTPQSSPTRTEGANPFGVPAAPTLSSEVSAEPARTPSPPAPRSRPQPTPNLSKLVAGILLNRVHAVGKPMRRNPRCGDESLGGGYVRSALRWEVSV